MKRRRSTWLPVLVLSTALLSLLGCDDRVITSEEKADKPKPSRDEAIPANLPKSFTDHVLGYHEKQVPFEMVLVSGDEAKSIKPYYIGKTEVSRAMFLRWAYGEDLDDWEAYYKLMNKGLRPSPNYSEHPALHVSRGTEDWLEYPALAMSWLTAESYCLWLSEQTGKTYRLPTDEEWIHVLELSGGVPEDRQELLSLALLDENTDYDDVFYYKQTRRVNDGKPNQLGLINLLGNAAEWVQSPGKERWVRGGYFELKADELNND